jgi:hypothetical protein
VIHYKAAEALLDFGSRIGDQRRAREQLEGAVAIHNILEKEGVAYLADEVGMGKTFVALGVIALFRHFNPDFRVLVIAPKENIQSKWQKEQQNFVANNIRFPDMRVKALGDQLAVPQIACANLASLAREAAINPNRDFFARLTSFSLPLSGSDWLTESAAWNRLKSELRRALPWLDEQVFVGERPTLKDNIARAVCCALPVFDLVIIDEGHNLKHGFQKDSAARNRVLSIALGHARGAGDPALFRGYGRRANRVLFLSATPIDGSWHHLWHQLDIVGRAQCFPELKEKPLTDADHARIRAAAQRILVRRVTELQVNGQSLTKNLYRREWRHGGVYHHDDPIGIKDDRQRLVLALVQKKVSEILDADGFKPSWQIGMLASFESFMVTAKAITPDGTPSAFDNPDQTESVEEKQGIDVHAINALAKDHRENFDAELPHPKMDALVDVLSDAWTKGEKALVFVRRVASVKELKRKLDDRYDAWLFSRLREELPAEVQRTLETAIARYRDERSDARQHDQDAAEISGRTRVDADRSGTDTFFSWFFRGEGPKGIRSGASIQKRFTSRSATWGTFFDDNYVADLLGVEPGSVTVALAQACAMDEPGLRDELRQRAGRFLGQAKRVSRGERFEAAQAAAIELLKDRDGPWRDRARALWHRLFDAAVKLGPPVEAPEIGDALETRTFFTELRKHADLRSRLWPASRAAHAEYAVLEEIRRAQLLSAAARLGHAFLDLYILVMARLRSLESRAQDDSDESAAGDLIDDFLTHLEQQMHTPLAQREWRAFDELEAIGQQFDLLLDVNLHELRTRELTQTARDVATVLGAQQPTGGMSGQVNQTLVRQFRMPGYPFVLITTDLLQEGEDLHTFCSRVMHYGIAWTPSAMEQRIGRIDRVRSLTERRLAELSEDPTGDQKMQVFYPYLQDTVEKLQVDTVLWRMDEFIRLMHEDLTPPRFDDPRIDLRRALFDPARPQGLNKRLKTAFPIDKKLLLGDVKTLAVAPSHARNALTRFECIRQINRIDGIEIAWEDGGIDGTLIGTAHFGDRYQPFELRLRSLRDRLLVRCSSPVGQVELRDEQIAGQIEAQVAMASARLGVIPSADQRTFTLTVEDDVLLADPSGDAERVGMMLVRVVRSADQLEQEQLSGTDARTMVLAGYREGVADGP